MTFKASGENYITSTICVEWAQIKDHKGHNMILSETVIFFGVEEMSHFS